MNGHSRFEVVITMFYCPCLMSVMEDFENAPNLTSSTCFEGEERREGGKVGWLTDCNQLGRTHT